MSLNNELDNSQPEIELFKGDTVKIKKRGYKSSNEIIFVALKPNKGKDWHLVHSKTTNIHKYFAFEELIPTRMVLTEKFIKFINHWH